MEELTVKTATISSIIFLILVILIFEMSSGADTTIHADEMNVSADLKSEHNEEEMIMEMNPEDNLEVPLPDTVSKDDVTISINMISKMVHISFSVKGGTFNVAGVVNTASQISQISYQSDNGMISIDISLNDYYETVWCLKEKRLYMRFLSLEKEKPVVIVDPGHGGTDVGADQNGTYEKNITMSVCRKLKKLTMNEEFKIYLTREGDCYPAVEERAAFANTLQPDLFVSVHANWYDDPSINGTSVLYNSLNGTEMNSSYWLADILDEEVHKSMGTVDMGLVEGNSIYVVRYTKVPAALVELGFMTNESDFSILISEEGQNNAANGLYKGIKRALCELGKVGK